MRQVNAVGPIIEHWTLGGGTALMIQIQHRESDDVDIFLPDPQLLPFLDPAKRDFTFEIVPSAYRSDGARFLKLSFSDIGEIDFIVARTLTSASAASRTVEGETILLETPSEIIAKKIYYRGTTITPRDIFDIAAAGESQADSIIDALRAYKDKVAAAVLAMEKLNHDFVSRSISQMAIRPRFRDMAGVAIERATKLLRAAS